MIIIKTYKALSLMLSYPSSSLKNNIQNCYSTIHDENIVNKHITKNLLVFINYINKNDLIYLQEEYVRVFDRQRLMSLYLFEHIHGDSRERGMAMVDLENLYKKSAFEINKGSELPDYIPLFLEYLAVLEKEKSENILGEVINIINVIKNRLININNEYSKVFACIEDLSKKKPDEKKIVTILKNDQKESVDNNWNEPKVF